ncbi:MAG TPA: GTPase [Thermoplasmata archaeon]
MPLRKGREDRGAAGEARPGSPPSSAILDAAFHKAHKATPHGDSHLDRSRRRAQLKIIRSGAVSLRHLSLATKTFRKPGLSEFEKELVTKAFGWDALGRALRRVQRADGRIRSLSREEQRRLRYAETTDAFAISVRRFYGRLASFLREVDPDLARLREIASFVKHRPRLRADQPTVVVAGFPNVGKSSLVAKLSSARPRIAAHPFTTLSIQVGHADLGFDRLQVLDTPGVLGRPGKGNPAEVEAETAVERAATAVVFVLDPSEQCGYGVADQERLLARWQAELPQVPFIEIETKSDLLRRTGNDRLRVSSVTGEGLEELRSRIQQALSTWSPPPSEAPAEEPSPFPLETPEEAPVRAMRHRPPK